MDISLATPAEIDALQVLLRAAGLPLDGFPEDAALVLTARENGVPVGCAALEFHENDALLRSVVVASEHRGRALGSKLVEAAIVEARLRGLAGVYLLTETAAGFFPRFGFRRVARRSVPEAVRRSVEFTSACPDSAMAFCLSLTDP